jgi:hypothetical protein
MQKSKIDYELTEIAAMAAVVLTATLAGFQANAQTPAPVEARSVVLVHEAWADGSSCAAVIPRLRAAGLKVTAVQNPLTSLDGCEERVVRSRSAIDRTAIMNRTFAVTVAATAIFATFMSHQKT